MTKRQKTIAVVAGAAGLLLAITVGTIWLLRGEPERELVVLLPPEGESEVAGQQRAAARVPTSAISFKASSGQVDPTQTSWQDPFTSAHWRSAGWQFVDGSMRTSGTAPAQATFHRTYRSLRVTATIERLSGAGGCEFRLYAPATNSTTAITVNNTLEVAEIQYGMRALIKQADITATLDSGRPCSIDVAASGNRIQLALNGRRLLTCDQPASQSGRDLLLTLASSNSEWRVRALRIEGE